LLPGTPENGGITGGISSPVLSKGKHGGRANFSSQYHREFLEEDLVKTNLLQLFTHPQHSEWFSNFLLLFFKSTLLLKETNILVKNFLFFICVDFPQYFYWPLLYCCFSCSCVLCNSIYKLSISTDMIIEIQITKLLANLFTESHWRQIFSRLKYVTHLDHIILTK